MKNLKKHFKEKYQLLLTESQLVEIARAALEDCKLEIIGQHITEPELSVNDLVRGEWYYYTDLDFDNWLIKFSHHDNKAIYSTKDIWLEVIQCKTENEIATHDIVDLKSIRHATREEVVRYFPNEFEVDSHGGNDIPRVTDEQL